MDNINQSQNNILPKSKMAIVSLLLGVSSLVLFALVPIFSGIEDVLMFLGVIAGICATLLGLNSIKKIRKKQFSGKNLAIVGIILGTLWVWAILGMIVYLCLAITGLIEVTEPIINMGW